MLVLERRISAARGELATYEQLIVAVRGQIAETDLQITSLREEQAQTVSEELRERRARRWWADRQHHYGP